MAEPGAPGAVLVPSGRADGPPAGAPPDGPRQRGRRVPSWAWALVPIAALAVFFLYPLVLVARQSVSPDTGGHSLEPWTEVLASPAFTTALVTTVWLAAAATAGCLVLGFTLALVLAFVPFPGSRLVARLIDVFLTFPSFLITLALLFVYGTAGLANGAWSDADRTDPHRPDRAWHNAAHTAHTTHVPPKPAHTPPPPGPVPV